MYKQQKGSKQNSDAVETVIGEGAVFEGNVSCEGSIKVEGNLKGDVKVGNTLMVGPNGSVTGDIKAGRVIVFGEVNGKTDSEALEIKSTGKITGEILVGTLITEAGGSMRAKCEMKDPGQQDSDDQVLTVSSPTQSSKPGGRGGGAGIYSIMSLPAVSSVLRLIFPRFPQPVFQKQDEKR